MAPQQQVMPPVAACVEHFPCDCCLPSRPRVSSNLRTRSCSTLSRAADLGRARSILAPRPEFFSSCAARRPASPGAALFLSTGTPRRHTAPTPPPFRCPIRAGYRTPDRRPDGRRENTCQPARTVAAHSASRARNARSASTTRRDHPKSRCDARAAQRACTATRKSVVTSTSALIFISCTMSLDRKLSNLFMK